MAYFICDSSLLLFCSNYLCKELSTFVPPPTIKYNYVKVFFSAYSLPSFNYFLFCLRFFKKGRTSWTDFICFILNYCCKYYLVFYLLIRQMSSSFFWMCSINFPSYFLLKEAAKLNSLNLVSALLDALSSTQYISYRFLGCSSSK